MGQRKGDGAHSGALVPVLAVALAALLWALAAAVARDLFDAGVPPIQLVEARAVITALGLAVLPAAWKKRGSASESASLWLVGALGLSIALVNVAYYTAISRVPVAVAIVLQYLGPGIVVGWIAFGRRTRPPSEVLVAVTIAFAGIVLVSEVLAADIEVDGLGLVAGLASAVFFATYTMLSERAVAAYGALGTVLRAFTAAAVVWLLYQVPQGIPEELFIDGRWPRVLFVGVGGTLLPFLLYIWGVKRLRSERAVITATLEPLFAALVAWLALDQVLSPMQIVGGAMILSAVVWLQLNAAPEAEVTTRPSPPPG